MEIADLKKASAEAAQAVWVKDDVHLLTGVELLISPTVAKQAQRDFNRTLRQMSLEQGGEEVTEDVIATTEDRLIVRAQLRDWRGLTKNGKEVLFSHDIADDLMQSDLFWDAVRRAATHVTALADAARRSLAKNSQGPSEQDVKAAEST